MIGCLPAVSSADRSLLQPLHKAYMGQSSIIQEYQNPQKGTTATFTNDEVVQNSISNDGFQKPLGYTVSYHGNPEVEKMHFGPKHPMKPWRLTLTNKLVMAYGMHDAMDIYLTTAATSQELTQFHKQEYIDFLQHAKPADRPTLDLGNGNFLYNMGDDCPIFDGLYTYCSLYAGASLDAARKLTAHQSDIAINWSGGLHHAKKTEASGFCYVNDIVLAILQLLIHHPRVLYIDIDVHHGDGVEQAFWSTDRVMTLSFHKYDKATYFPGTGGLDTTGPKSNSNPGAHHSLNVPLHDGIDDFSYVELFKNIVGPCVSTYNPTAIVLQCGADSLGGDRLGCFNLNVRAHGACVAFTKTFKVPLLVLGGGGYTARNVARLWAYETSVCIGAEVDPSIPLHTPFIETFDPDRTLFPPLHLSGRYDNKNTRAYLDGVVASVLEQLRYLQGSPSVQMQHVPPDLDLIRYEVNREIREEREEREAAGKGRKAKEKGLGIRGELVR